MIKARPTQLRILFLVVSDNAVMDTSITVNTARKVPERYGIHLSENFGTWDEIRI